MTNESKQTLAAQSISPADEGFVTARMLHEYMQSIQPQAGAPINWDVTSVNIKCNGKNVVSADGQGNISFGNPYDNATLRGNDLAITGGNIDTRATGLALYGYGTLDMGAYRALGIKADTIDIIAEGRLYEEGTQIELHGWGDVKLDAGVNAGITAASNIMNSARGRIGMDGSRVWINSSGDLNLTALAIYNSAHNLYQSASDDLELHGNRVSINGRVM